MAKTDSQRLQTHEDPPFSRMFVIDPEKITSVADIVCILDALGHGFFPGTAEYDKCEHLLKEAE